MDNDSSEVNPESVAKLKVLEEMYEKVKEKHDDIRNRVSIVDCNNRKVTAEYTKADSEYKKLFEHFTNIQLNCESGTACLQSKQNEINEKLVEHSLIQMRLHQMQNSFEKQLEKFYDLEHHKLQLQLLIDERMLDIKCELELLGAKKKDFLNEQSLLKADIAERNSKIIALRTRFELENELLGKNDDGSTITAVQLKIQTAQERQILLERGSELDKKVIAAEKDIKAMENTLTLLNHSNERYKRKMNQISDDGKYSI